MNFSQRQLGALFMDEMRLLIIFAVLASAMGAENATGDDHETSSSNNIDNGGRWCKIPSSWHGDWYQYNEGTGGTNLVSVNETDISSMGRCDRLSPAAGAYKHEKEYEMVLVSRDRSGSACLRCMLIFERHENIIQYRISQRCAPDSESACTSMDISRPMLIMFRANAVVEACPISGPANFSYTTVTDERCESQKSTIGGCVDQARLRLNYIACPGMRMESRIDDVLCIGQFEAFGKKYFLGKMINKASAGSEGDLHRCFTYETSSSGGTLMMSADASCQSLDINQASVQIRYVNADATPKPACSFRPWLRYRKHNKDESIVWESLSSANTRHVFDRHHWTVENTQTVTKGTSRTKTINLCIHYVTDHKDEKGSDGARLERLVVYTIDECERGYRCVEFYHHPKRTQNQVMDVLVGQLAATPYDACKPEYFQRHSLHFQTLLDTSSKEQECPSEHRGQYRIRGCDKDDATLYFGCGDTLTHALVFYEDCGQKGPAMYYCYGDWIDPDNSYVHYLAVKDASSGMKTCFAYARSSEDDQMSMSTFRQHSCKRGILPGVNGHRAYNLTKTGQCGKIPLHVANLTHLDAYSYAESSLSARSISGRSDSSTVNAGRCGWLYLLTCSIVLLLR